MKYVRYSTAIFLLIGALGAQRLAVSADGVAEHLANKSMNESAVGATNTSTNTSANTSTNDSAIKLANELSDDSTARADECFRNGVGSLNSGKLEDSIAQFKNAVLLRPDFGNAWYNLSQLYAATGNLPEAKRCLEQFLQYFPAGTRANGARAQLKYFETMLAKPKASMSTKDYFDQLAATEIARWPKEKKSLKVCILSAENVGGYNAQFKEELLAALSSWSAASDGAIAFSFVDDPESADLIVGWSDRNDLVVQENESGDCRLTIEPKTREIKRALIVLLTKPPMLQMSPVLAFNVSLHEVGHALGIYGHSRNSGDVMYFFSLASGKRRTLSERDIATLKRIYSQDLTLTK